MPINHNNGGSTQQVTPYVRKSGQPVEPDVYIRKNGSAVLVHDSSGSNWSTLSSFESDPVTSGYEGETSDFTEHTSNPIAGSQSIEGTSSADWIATTDIPTPRTDSNGNPVEYRLATRMDIDETMIPRVCVQDPSSGDGGYTNHYALRFTTGDNFQLQMRDGSTSTSVIAGKDLDQNPSEGDEYVLGIRLDSSDITGLLYEHAGNGDAGAKIDQITTTNTTHTGGYFGLATGNSAGSVADELRWNG
jgi:hypothetical protein